MLFALMFCYLFYYTGRQNFGWAVPLMLDDDGLGLTATQLGTISGVMLLCYGIGQSINGNLGDKFGGRIMVTLGGLISSVFNWITSFGTSFYSILFPWAANGFAQSMGWAPGSRMISNWWDYTERGKAFGWYVASSASASVVIFALGIIVITYLPWQWVFRLPVLLLVFASLIFFLIARNRPRDLGFEPVTENIEHANPKTNGSEESSFTRYTQVLKKGRFLFASLSMGFVSMARYGLITWVPLHYMGPNWRDDPSGLWITLALPIGMALGALSTGYISDRFFFSNRSRPIAIFLFLATIVMFLIFLLPPERRIIGIDSLISGRISGLRPAIMLLGAMP
jgi:MFS transporter, OPA family, glycerol-3-phosphate transporter